MVRNIKEKIAKGASFAAAWEGLFGSLEYTAVMEQQPGTEITIDWKDGAESVHSAADVWHIIFDSNQPFMLSANGTYTFTGRTNGTYYITVNEFRGLATGTVGDGTLAVEQTYASAGNGAGDSGPICVGAAPGYTQQSGSSPSTWVSGAQNGNKLAGPCFGGRTRNAGNAVNGTPAIGDSEQVIRVQLQNNNVTGVDFGFSANVVTNLGTGYTQGTLASFLKLANVLSGANAMRFVPVEVTNQSSGANKWWRLAMGTALPQITAADTTVDGTAYSNVNGKRPTKNP